MRGSGEIFVYLPRSNSVDDGMVSSVNFEMTDSAQCRTKYSAFFGPIKEASRGNTREESPDPEGQMSTERIKKHSNKQHKSHSKPWYL